MMWHHHQGEPVPELTADQATRAADPALHDLGTAFMLHPETPARGTTYGYPSSNAFYFAGRGGVLGEVDADVVTAAMGWFQPDLVAKMWGRGIAVAGARQAARHYAEACAEWGRDHLGRFPGADRLAALAERVVRSADVSGLSLFAGWRAMPLVDDGPGRAQQLVHVLREWRGSLHLAATTAVGLSPLEAILTNEGEAQARSFGWRDDLPDCRQLKGRHDQAEQMTDALSAVVYQRALTPAERGEFADLVIAANTAVRE
jgi:hypothetical protein